MCVGSFIYGTSYNKDMQKKRIVKYYSLLEEGQKVTEAYNVLFKKKNKTNKCKCHHQRISTETGLCTFGKCRHEAEHHKRVDEVLFN